MKENGNGTFHDVDYEKLDLVRTSTHIDRWGSDGKGSLIINAREDSSIETPLISCFLSCPYIIIKNDILIHYEPF